MSAYGFYGSPSNYQGGGYSANPVTSGPDEGGGYGGGYQGSAFPISGDPSGGRGAMVDSNAAQTPGSATDSGGGGMGAAGWMGLFQMIGDKLQGRVNAQSAAAAAANDIPADPRWQQDLLRQMAVEGQQLKDSKLGARPMMQANELGHNSAVSRGLSGPLAAAVQQEAVGNAQSSYDRWRQSALMAHRNEYMNRVQQYMQQLQAYKQAQIRAGYAHRAATLARLPVGPIGGSIYSAVLDQNNTSMPGTGPADTANAINGQGQWWSAPGGGYTPASY